MFAETTRDHGVATDASVSLHVAAESLLVLLVQYQVIMILLMVTKLLGTSVEKCCFD